MDDLGPFFPIDRFDGSSSWRPLLEFGTDPAGLAAVLASVGQSLTGRGTAPTKPAVASRVVSSVGFLALAARLVSPVLGVVAGDGVLPELGWADLWWRRGPGVQLSLAAGPVMGASVVGPDALVGPAGAAAVLRMAIRPVLDLGSVVTAGYRVSPLIVRGNVGSAVFGAATVIAASARARADPRVGDRARRLAADLLAQPELSGAGLLDSRDRGPATFRRRSCCLLYRVPGAQLCGDCVLRSR